MANQKIIRLFIVDLDGTLVTPEKELTAGASDAVARLEAAGVLFSLTSGRPPRGMRMITSRVQVTAPISAFNGGRFVRPDLSLITEHTLDEPTTCRVLDAMRDCGLDAWIYQGDDWFIHDPRAPHVEREAKTVQFPPTVIDKFPDPLNNVVKIVGVSDDYDRVARCEAAVRAALGDHISASRSQPYYLDVTHPQANKCHVVAYLSDALHIPPAEIATIGDMPSDVSMFRCDGLSIAMGNASDEVKAQADFVTQTNTEEGFARAVDYLLSTTRAG